MDSGLVPGYAGTSATNPRGAETARWRVVRGGAWNNNDTAFVRAANRVGYVPSILVNIIGFRCVGGD